MFDINNHFTYAYSAGTEADFEQALTGDAASTNALDLKKAAINIAAGKRPIYLIVKAGNTADFNTLTSLEIQLCTGTSIDKSTGKKVIQKWRYALAGLTAGTLLVNQALPVALYQRYLYLYFNVLGSDPSAGGIKAYLSDSPESAETDVDQTATGS